MTTLFGITTVVVVALTTWPGCEIWCSHHQEETCAMKDCQDLGVVMKLHTVDNCLPENEGVIKVDVEIKLQKQRYERDNVLALFTFKRNNESKVFLPLCSIRMSSTRAKHRLGCVTMSMSMEKNIWKIRLNQLARLMVSEVLMRVAFLDDIQNTVPTKLSNIIQLPGVYAKPEATVYLKTTMKTPLKLEEFRNNKFTVKGMPGGFNLTFVVKKLSEPFHLEFLENHKILLTRSENKSIVEMNIPPKDPEPFSSLDLNNYTRHFQVYYYEQKCQRGGIFKLKIHIDNAASSQKPDKTALLISWLVMSVVKKLL